MRAIFTIVCYVLSLSFLQAQTRLEYSQAIIFSNTPQVVPSGKVWKVTSVYGQEVRINECVNASTGSTHEIGERIKCSIGNVSAVSLRLTYFIRSMIVNGVSIPVNINGVRNGSSSANLFSTNNCTGSTGCCYDLSAASCINMATDPTLLPLWIPAGGTIQSGGPNTFISVIEFNVIP